MCEPSRTHTTSVLLEALGDPANETVWYEFDARYRPIIHGFAHRLGLDPEDAAEVAQQTLAEFLRDYREGRYDRSRGRLSSWIMGIARHRAIDLQRARGRRREVQGASALVDLADEQQLTKIWEDQRQQSILAHAMRELKETTKTSSTTLRAFEMVALQGVPAAKASEECSITVDAVYRIKNRITTQLRQIVARLSEVYAEDD